MPKACSPTALRLPSGAAARKIPSDLACLVSIFSSPAPNLPINFRFLALSKNLASIENLLRIMSPS